MTSLIRRSGRWLAGSTLVIALAAPALAADGDTTPPAPPAPPVAPATPDTPAAPRSVEDLIADLGLEDYRAREAATEALAARGTEALPALRKAATADDPEVRWRAEKAIAAIEARGGRALGAGETPAGHARPPEAPGTPGAAPRLPGERGPLPPRLRREGRPEIPGFDRELERMVEDLERAGFPREFAERLRRQFGEMEERMREFGIEPMPIPPMPRERGLPIPPLVPPIPDPRGDDRDRDGGAPGFDFEFRVFEFRDGEWRTQASPSRAERRLGARAEPVPPALRESLGLGADGSGLYVQDVQPGSIAERAGLKRHDVVRTIDGAPASAAKDLGRLLTSGDHRVQVLRGGASVELTVSGPQPQAPAPAPPTPRPPEPRSY